MGDQVQLADLAVRGTCPTGRHRSRSARAAPSSGGSKVLSTDSADDIDAADGQPDGVAAQMVGQRFDLGKFGHVQSAETCPRST